MDVSFPLSLDEVIAGFVEQTSMQLPSGGGVVFYPMA